ncbi:N-formylglutamate amidohydrolase [Thioalkalicoccus limnaeus]|uniref:N-formylglutamate amidohydrolase n=1 Tax=Thioalkalicoccus limnaeus TaxID=120681 RepID=A0ABV4BHS8_9GAMM
MLECPETRFALLDPREPPAFEIVNERAGGCAVIVCDHASHRVPRRLGTLGLTPEQIADHIGWDPGAAEVARRLSVQLDAPLVLSGYSRLVIDCNRPLGSASSIAEQSDGIPIPGNLGLTPGERAQRVEGLFHPYHKAIDRLLSERSHERRLLLSLHSFTPVLNGRERPWPIGVSHWRDRRFATLLREALSGGLDGPIGDNAPYPIEDDIDYTVPIHADRHRLPAVMIEIRNDGLRTAEDIAAWAGLLAEACRRIETEATKLGRSTGETRPTRTPSTKFISPGNLDRDQ